ncbi:MAG: flagellar basal body P-ring formation protein FlgA [Proteobacteria bacterium]|nr:flagellar basal body P-ring formation protein FlgA [Pseudomonadota bacterium]
MIIRLILAVLFGLALGFAGGAPLGLRNAHAAAPSAQAAAQAGTPAYLNEQVMVSDGLVRLGDLFANVPAERAGIAVGYAPAPGRRAIFDVRWLLSVARSYRIDWRPTSRYDRVIVERASQIVSGREIEEAVRQALAKSGLGPDIDVHLSQTQLELHIPKEADPTILVEDLAQDEPSGRFSAAVVVSPNSPQAVRTRIAGRVSRLVEVPVPAQNVAPGAVIRQDDVRWLKLPAERLTRNVVTDASELIGKAAKRALRADAPVQVADIQRPVLVAKGSLVTIVLTTPSMSLTAQGKALEDGADGDTIPVMNTRSRRVLDAMVAGSGQVRVVPALRLVSQ